MKKKSLIAPVYLILLFVFIFLTSCTNNNGLSQTNSSPTSENPSSQTSSNPIVEETFLITFDANGGEFEDGSAKKVVEIDSGQLLTLPTTALEHRSFYTFVGWSYLSDPNELWDFSNDVVQREMTLYAMWQSQWFDYEIIDNEATIIDSNLDASTTTIEIPSAIRDVDGKDYSVTTIGYTAFSDCNNLTSVVIPNSVTTIGDYAFHGCNNLTSVVIPSSVTTIGYRAFSGCNNLTIYCEATSQPSGWDSSWNWNVSWSSSLPVVWGYVDSSTTTEYEYAVCKDEEGNEYITLVRYIGSSTEVIIPEFIEHKGENIPVTTIGDYAFYGCNNLTSIAIPNSVTTIGNSAFSDCNNLTIYCEATSQPSGWDSNWNWNVSWSSSLPVVWGYVNSSTTTEYEYAVCKDEEGNEYITLVRYIGSSTEVIIPEFIEHKGENIPVTTIGDYAFSDCNNLTSVVIPSSVTTIGYCAFYGCNNLTSIAIPNSVTTIGNGAFSGCSSLTSVVIPSSVTTIGNGAFSGCNNLTSVVIPNSVTTIGNGAFSGCSSLTSVVIPNSVTTIGSFAFSGCNNLTSVVIPNSVTTIGDYAFSDCNNLTIYCEATSQPSGWDSGWNWNLGHDSIIIPVVWGYVNSSTTTEYEYAVCKDEEGNEYITLVRYIGSSTEVIIPEFIEHKGENIPVTTIGDYAFSDCNNLTSVVIPSSVTTIGYCAFYGCNNLTSVVIPSSVTTIGHYAFSDCNNLTIYCEATSQPSGWDSNWNWNVSWSSSHGSIPVVWGYNSEN